MRLAMPAFYHHPPLVRITCSSHSKRQNLRQRHYKWTGTGLAAEGFVGSLGEGAGSLQVGGIGGVVPICEVSNEVEQGGADVFVGVEVSSIVAGGLNLGQALGAGEVAGAVRPRLHLGAGDIAEGGRAEWVGRVRPEGGTDDGATGGEGTARPPDVERGDVAVADALL